MDNKVIVLYGGSFNPPANSHFVLAQEIVEKYRHVEKLIFMPVSCNYNKKGLVDNEHRYNMLKLICDEIPKFEVSRIEIDSTRQLYTIETLEILQKEYPEHTLWFTIGTDNLKELNTWKRPEELISKYKILILERDQDNMGEIIEKDDLLKEYQQAFIKVNNTHTDLSSSIIREKIKSGESVEEDLPEKINLYIQEFNLYMD